VSTPAAWGRAYARQAKFDFDAWNALQGNPDLPECQKLHFLQMACEKLVKAHLCLAGSNPHDLRTSHAYIAKNLPIIIREQFLLENAALQKVFRKMEKVARLLAREIELLHPAVEAGGKRPDNCEYPWENGKKKLHVPGDWKFFTEQLLTQPFGRMVLKLVGLAIARLARK
jgi:hypothetical protein